MIENIEKAIFDAFYELAPETVDAMRLRELHDEILHQVNSHVEEERDSGYESGFEDGEQESYWGLEDARSEGFSEGYDEGYEAASAKFNDGE